MFRRNVSCKKILLRRHQKTTLSRRHADLVTILYQMEHDKILNVPEWQIRTVRKQLKEMDHR